MLKAVEQVPEHIQTADPGYAVWTTSSMVKYANNGVLNRTYLPHYGIGYVLHHPLYQYPQG